MAELAATIGSELHRWEMLTDFYVYTGYGNRQMLGLTPAGLAQCGGSCRYTANLLVLQDQRLDQTVVLDGGLLSASAFASALTSGFTNQQSCQANSQCPYEAHVLNIEFLTPETCGQLNTYAVSTPTGGNLNNPASLNNALVWTATNGPNPLIDFQSTATTVRIDPTGGLNGGGQVLDPAGCSVYSPDVNLTGSSCVCTTSGVNNGELIETHPQLGNVSPSPVMT